MADKVELRARLDYHRDVLKKLRTAYVKLLESGTQSYTIDDRTLTRLDLGKLKKQIKEEEDTVDELEEALKGKKPRKAFGIVPRDW